MHTTFKPKNNYLLSMKPILVLPFFVIALFINSINISAQVFLQMEKYGSTKVDRFSVGSELTFLVKGDEENWRTEYIEKLVPEEAIRSYKSGKWSRVIAGNLYTFGASWGLYTVIGSIFTDEVELDWSTAIVVGTSAALGFLIQKIFKHRTYVMGERRRLRLLDLTVDPIRP